MIEQKHFASLKSKVYSIDYYIKIHNKTKRINYNLFSYSSFIPLPENIEINNDYDRQLKRRNLATCDMART